MCPYDNSLENVFFNKTCERINFYIFEEDLSKEDMFTLFASSFKHLQCSFCPRRYLYFDVVVGLVWSHDPKSYAGGSVCYW
jgi:hypothetical protein